MTKHPNRGRFIIDLDGKWQLYTLITPANMEILGTVTTPEGETGALGRFLTSGIYVRLNAGAARSLPQNKIAAALEEAKDTITTEPYCQQA